MNTDDFIAELWEYALRAPMREHPWFQGIAQHRWTREEIIVGEVQHYLRVRQNPVYFGYIAVNAAIERQPGLTEVVLQNYIEELAGDRSHVDIMFQFLDEGGVSREEADSADPAPGTLAAIEMILGHCQRRSALEGIAMLAFVESQHGGLPTAPRLSRTLRSPATTGSPSTQPRHTESTQSRTSPTGRVRSRCSVSWPRTKSLRSAYGAP